MILDISDLVFKNSTQYSFIFSGISTESLICALKPQLFASTYNIFNIKVMEPLLSAD